MVKMVRRRYEKPLCNQIREFAVWYKWLEREKSPDCKSLGFHLMADLDLNTVIFTTIKIKELKEVNKDGWG